MTSLIGNNVAGMVFDMAKSLDRVTITVYQSAAGPNILSWLSSSVDTLITALGKAVYFPFLAPVVIIGAIWLAWQGLIRKRATRTIEGTIWMVIACAAAIWLIGQPQDFTGVGTTVSNGVSSVLNTAFANLPANTTGTGSNCLPIQQNDPDSVTSNYAFTSGSGLVDENANELWSVLVCKPWLVGEFGTSQYAPINSAAARTNVVNEYGRSLLFAQAVATNETSTAALTQEKQAVYNGIAMDLQTQNPAVYALFQGDQWTTRLEIAFTALFAAVAAGLLVLLIALTLIILKLGFLLLLVAGPFFLIVGVHPGFGRVVAIRWFEMLVGVLLKQVAVALVLVDPSLLLLADHEHHRSGAALGAQDHDDLTGHGGRVHLQEAVPAPVLLGRLRHARRQRTGRNLVARVRLRVPPDHRHHGGHRRARRGAPAVARPAGRAAPRRTAAGRRRDRAGAVERGVRATSADGDVRGADGRQPLRRAAVAGGRGRHRTHGTAAAAADQRRRADRERRLGGLGQGRRRGGGRSARSGTTACPHDRPDARRARAAAAPGGAARAEAVRGGAAGCAADDVDAACADAVHAAARTAVLVAVPPSAPLSGAGHGTLARQAAAAVCRRRHRARRPRHLR